MTTTPLTFETREEAFDYFWKLVNKRLHKDKNYQFEDIDAEFTQWLSQENVIIKSEMGKN